MSRLPATRRQLLVGLAGQPGSGPGLESQPARAVQHGAGGAAQDAQTLQFKVVQIAVTMRYTVCGHGLAH